MEHQSRFGTGFEDTKIHEFKRRGSMLRGEPEYNHPFTKLIYSLKKMKFDGALFIVDFR